VRNVKVEAGAPVAIPHGQSGGPYVAEPGVVVPQGVIHKDQQGPPPIITPVTFMWKARQPAAPLSKKA